MFLSDIFDVINNKFIKNITAHGEQSGEVFPERSIAQVLEIKGKNALLKMQGRSILARVDTPVKKGEYLLLQFKGSLDQSHYFKVLERSSKADFVTSGNAFFLIKMPLKELSVPVFFRYHFEYGNNEDFSGKGSVGSVSGFILEFIVETKNFGLILLRIQRKNEHYFGKLFLDFEKPEVEKFLETFHDNISLALNHSSITFQEIKCVKMPSWLKEDAYNSFKKSVTLDKKV